MGAAAISAPTEAKRMSRRRAGAFMNSDLDLFVDGLAGPAFVGRRLAFIGSYRGADSSPGLNCSGFGPITLQ
jgi:hypothetical protein